MNMITTITAKEFLRNYKDIIKTVQRTKRPIVVTNHEEPQVAIVNLNDLEVLKALSNKGLDDFLGQHEHAFSANASQDLRKQRDQGWR